MKTRFRYADLDLSCAIIEDSALPDITKAAQRAGIELVQAHASDNDIELIKRQIAVHAVTKPGSTWERQRAANKAFLGSLLAAAEKHNVSILLENSCDQHGKWYYYTTARHLLVIVADLGFHPLISAVWDTGHAHMQGVDQYSELLELGSRIAKNRGRAMALPRFYYHRSQ